MNMTAVRFTAEAQYQFARQFLIRRGQVEFDARFEPARLEITLSSAVVARLFERAASGGTAMLPYRGADSAPDTWLLTGSSQRALDGTLEQISHLLLPTYAEFDAPSRLPERQAFTPEANDLQRWGAELYPVGYYRMKSPPQYFDTILERLDLWMQLEARQPPPLVREHPSYAGLYADFTQALAAASWRDAEAALGAMRRHHLSSADNLAFLEIQALAQQQQWDIIWCRTDYPDLAKLRVPRPVRGALLTAFHHAELLALEEQGQWEEAVAAFRQHRPRLGRLLTGRLDLSQAPVVQAFAFEAVFAGDRNAWPSLRAANPSRQAQRCLDALERFLPAVVVQPPHHETPEYRTRLALADRNFDDARAAAAEVADPVTRAILLMEIAFQSGDAANAEEALLAFWGLPDEVQEHVRLTDQRVLFFVDALTRLVTLVPAAELAAAPPPTARSEIESWLDWFQAVQSGVAREELEAALNRLQMTADERYWTPDRLRDLVGALHAFFNASDLLSRPLGRGGIRRLVEYFLRDDGFPQEGDEYGDVYDALYTGHVLVGEVNANTSAMLLRLVDALLARAPARREELWTDVRKWYSHPVPKLEERVIEAFELFAEYGLPGGLTVPLYRDWVWALLNQPQTRERVALEAWLALGKWAQPGDDVLHRLAAQVEYASERDVDNPLEMLPEGHRIGIFSLRSSSAERAKQLLLARNAHLDVRVCGSRDLDDSAKALAKHADIAVVVSTCISHALFYGIGPHLRVGPVYPSSCGSTGIVRAVEDYVRQRRAD